MASARQTQPWLVTGGTGLVGRAVVEVLQQRSIPMVIIGRRPRPAELDATLLYEQVDLVDLASVAMVLAKLRPAAILHLAAESDANWCQANPDKAWASNVTAVDHLLTVRDQIDPAIFVTFASTDLVFAGTESFYRSDAPTEPLSHYGTTKAKAEGLVNTHTSTAVVRLSLVLGDGTATQPSLVDKMLATALAGRALPLFVDEFRTPILVEDAAKILVELTAQRRGGVWHAGGDRKSVV